MAVPIQVANVVRSAFGPEAEILGVEIPGEWAVARLRLSGHASPSSVVAKWLRSNRSGWRTDPDQLVTEAVALRFVSELAPGLVPKVLAANLDHAVGAVLLLEDLSPREPLDAVIRREGAAATAHARRAYAQAMGRLAASTVRCEDDFEQRFGSTPSRNPATGRLRIVGQPWEKVRGMLEGFGVRVPTIADDEAAQLYKLFGEPGPFLALSNGDMATNNFMINPAANDDGRLIDFEFAHFDHALAHAANFFVPGPRWTVLNDPIDNQLEQEFRTALVQGIPGAADDQRYHDGIAAGCVAMGFERCGNLTSIDSRSPGHPSRAQRVATVEAAADAADARHRWSALSAVLRDLARVLRRRWPDTDVDFSSLPPYTPCG